MGEKPQKVYCNCGKEMRLFQDEILGKSYFCESCRTEFLVPYSDFKSTLPKAEVRQVGQAEIRTSF